MRAASPTLALSFLGPPVVEVDGSPLLLTRRKVTALLAYLAVTSRKHSRDFLAEMFYPGHDRERAYSDLRNTLTMLRGAIGEDRLETGRDGVSLSRRTRVWIDLEELRALSGPGKKGSEEDLEKAAALIRGPFLAGFYLKDCPGFEEWQNTQAEALRVEEAGILGGLLGVLERRREYSEAVGVCRRLLSLDTLDEDMHRRLMHLYWLAGHRSAALAQYERCRELLRKELGVNPGEETEHLLQELKNGPSVPKGPANARQPDTKAAPDRGAFVGRDAELNRVKQSVDQGRGGIGRFLLVAGEAGIGKTRLLEEASDYARDSGRLVVWARCHNDPGLPPYWPWRQLLLQLFRASNPEQVRRWAGTRGGLLCDLVPEAVEALGKPRGTRTTNDPESARFLLSEAVDRFLREAAHERPLMLVFDDVHWADSASLGLLEFVSRDCAASRLLVLAACREGEAATSEMLDHTLVELSRERCFERVDLDALDRSGVARLAELSRGSPPAPWLVEMLFEKTRGNPLFVIELLRSIGTSDPRETGISVPPSLKSVIRGRLEKLSRPCNEMLQAAAALGAEFRPDLVGRVLGRTEQVILALLDEADAARLITTSADQPEAYRFSHPLIYEVIESEPGAALRTEMHARIAEVLEEHYGDDAGKHAIELAYHLEQAKALAPRQKLCRFAQLAGDQAFAAFSPLEAVVHFRAGLAAKGSCPADAESAWLRFGLAKVLLPAYGHIGVDHEGAQCLGAFAELQAAFEYFEKSADAEAAAKVAQLPLVLFNEAEGSYQSLFERGLRFASPDSLDECRLRWRSAQVDFMRNGDYAAASREFERAQASARHHGEPQLELHILAAWLWPALDLESPQKASALLGRALELLRVIDDPAAELQVRFRAYHWALAMSDVEDAARNAEAVFRAASRLRVPWFLHGAFLIRLELAWIRGDCIAALAVTEEAFPIAETDYKWQNAPCGYQYWHWFGLRAKLEFELGNDGAAKRFLGTYLKALDRIGPNRDPECSSALVLLAQLSRLTGDQELVKRARAAIAMWIEPGQEAAATEATALDALIALAILAPMHGDRAEAERVRQALTRATYLSFPSLYPTKPRLLGQLALILGDPAAAVSHSEAAISQLRRLGRPNADLGWACRECAEALLARGGEHDRRRAAASLDEGLHVAESLGLKLLAGHVGELRKKANGRPNRPREMPSASAALRSL